MEQRLTAQLRTKSQRRRAALAISHAATSAVRPRNDLLPKLQLVGRNIDDLSAPARNVRTADPAHVREIANAIATLGFNVPILIDQDGRVLDGWARVEAARTGTRRGGRGAGEARLGHSYGQSLGSSPPRAEPFGRRAIWAHGRRAGA